MKLPTANKGHKNKWTVSKAINAVDPLDTFTTERIRQCRNSLQRMMTSSNGNISSVTGTLWGESTGSRWIPLTKANDAEFWCFLWLVSEQTVEQTIETPII